VIGEGRNIAAMCRLITRPVADSGWPWSRMCTGVMVMIASITSWLTTITVAASRTLRGLWATGATTGVLVTSGVSCARRANSRGSGRSITPTITAPTA